MLYPELSDKLLVAKRVFEAATSENIIEHSEKYLALLKKYYEKLYQHPGSPQGNLQPGPSSSWETVAQIQKAVKEAIDQTVKERNRIAALLDSFIYMTGDEVIDTLNRLKYKGRDSWHFGEGGLTAGGEMISLHEAVNTASLLRREEYVRSRPQGAVL
jgi:hypothetical protein